MLGELALGALQFGWPLELWPSELPDGVGVAWMAPAVAVFFSWPAGTVVAGGALGAVEGLRGPEGSEGIEGKNAYGDPRRAADVFLVPQMYRAQRFGVELTKYPRTVGAAEAALATDAAQLALPERQPDFKG